MTADSAAHDVRVIDDGGELRLGIRGHQWGHAGHIWPDRLVGQHHIEGAALSQHFSFRDRGALELCDAQGELPAQRRASCASLRAGVIEQPRRRHDHPSQIFINPLTGKQQAHGVATSPRW